jgi:16S rRNA (guanine527-N7)-methyltransferase
MEQLDCFASLVKEEASRQNLVSASSLETVWQRHIADSAQLLRFAPSPGCSWLDLGSGAGFPGLVVALLHQGPVRLIEERRLRVEFLRRCAATLGLDVEITHSPLQRVEPRPYDAISARAFARLGTLLELAYPFSTAKSRWVLPKGRNAQSELDALEASWQGDFRLEPSATDANARIIVADGVRRARERHT